MDTKLLAAIEEMTDRHFLTLEEAQKEYSPREIFEMYLTYEGIIGYTDQILGVLTTLGLISQVEVAIDDRTNEINTLLMEQFKLLHKECHEGTFDLTSLSLAMLEFANYFKSQPI